MVREPLSARPNILKFGYRLPDFAIRKWRTTPTRDWTIVEGSVQHAKMIVGGGRDVGKYAVIAYSYFVDEYRSGEYTRTFVREDSALKFADAMRDKKVQVHYNPRDPDLSNLKDDEVDRLLLETDEAKVS